ncbi:hypothetical protein C8F01DRAFT_1281779 [Mycena amicta]|nr:hypothetical protein C8F01DRAFT_1281779 [Mycena amicta]
MSFRTIHPSRINPNPPVGQPCLRVQLKELVVAQNELSADYPYILRRSHRGAFRIPYFEFHGIGPPCDCDIGGSVGDVYVDVTESAGALYGHTKDGWHRWRLESEVDDQVLELRPFIEGLVDQSRHKFSHVVHPFAPSYSLGVDVQHGVRWIQLASNARFCHEFKDGEVVETTKLRRMESDLLQDLKAPRKSVPLALDIVHNLNPRRRRNALLQTYKPADDDSLGKWPRMVLYALDDSEAEVKMEVEDREINTVCSSSPPNDLKLGLDCHSNPPTNFDPFQELHTSPDAEISAALNCDDSECIPSSDSMETLIAEAEVVQLDHNVRFRLSARTFQFANIPQMHENPYMCSDDNGQLTRTPCSPVGSRASFLPVDSETENNNNTPSAAAAAAASQLEFAIICTEKSFRTPFLPASYPYPIEATPHLSSAVGPRRLSYEIKYHEFSGIGPPTPDKFKSTRFGVGVGVLPLPAPGPGDVYIDRTTGCGTAPVRGAFGTLAEHSGTKAGHWEWGNDDGAVIMHPHLEGYALWVTLGSGPADGEGEEGDGIGWHRDVDWALKHGRAAAVKAGIIPTPAAQDGKTKTKMQMLDEAGKILEYVLTDKDESQSG